MFQLNDLKTVEEVRDTIFHQQTRTPIQQTNQPTEDSKLVGGIKTYFKEEYQKQTYALDSKTF